MTNEDVGLALLRLNDELCSLERNAGSGATLILIPHDTRLPIHVSMDGKPQELPADVRGFVEQNVGMAFMLRGDDSNHAPELVWQPCCIAFKEKHGNKLALFAFLACENCGTVIKNRYGNRGVRIDPLDAKWLNSCAHKDVTTWLASHSPFEPTPGRMLAVDPHANCIDCNGTGWTGGVMGSACDVPRLQSTDTAKTAELLVIEARRCGLNAGLRIRVHNENEPLTYTWEFLHLPNPSVPNAKPGIGICPNGWETDAPQRDLDMQETRALLAALRQLHDGDAVGAVAILRDDR
jgi:hypothetical protein